jgi:hypothetical protein
VRELKKKPDAQEMLIVHKPPLKGDPDKSGRERGGSARVPAMAEELEIMRKKLSQARDPREKRHLLAEIQRRFGNEKAGQLIQEVRQGGDEDTPLPSRKGKP